MNKQDIRKEFMIENDEKGLAWFTNHTFYELAIYAEWLENKVIDMEKDVIREI